MEKTYMSSLIAKEGTGKEIQEAIDQINTQNYGAVLAGILSCENKKATTTLERNFLQAVNSNFEHFAEGLIYEYYKTFSKERLLQCVIEYNMEGIYCFTSYCDNCEADEFVTTLNLDEKIKVDMLKNFLTATLDRLLDLESKERDKAAQAEKERQINRAKVDIECYERRIKELEEKLEQLEG